MDQIGHPNLFAFSIICFAEAYYCKQQLRPYNLKLNFDWRTKLHIAWAALGTYAADYGFYCIYVQKNLKQKDHFTSWHGKMGLLGRSPIKSPFTIFILVDETVQSYGWRPYNALDWNCCLS